MLFIHDHTFVSKNGEFYTTGSLNQKVMDRYKEWFGMVSVYATTREATDRDSAFIRGENRVNNIDFHLASKKNSIVHLMKCYKSLNDAVEKADCIVVRMSIFGAMGVMCARKQRKPYMIEMVACPWDSLWYHSIKGKILAPFMTILTKAICKDAPRVLYVTNEFLQRRYPTKGVTIACSDVELINVEKNIIEKRIAKIQKQKSGEPLKLCTVANIAVKYKGQDIVVRSLKRLKNGGLPCEYYLIGGGDPQRLLKIAEKEGVADLIHIVGAIPHEEVFQWIDRMDLYVQPSKQEGLPRAVIEAMSRACPVVGANTGGIPELIAKDMVFKKSSVKDFIHVMKNLTTEKLQQRAVENWQMAFQYEKKTLDKKRNKFYREFAREVRRSGEM